MKPFPGYAPDWRWGTPEGSRDCDRQLDRALAFREKLEWLEEAETLTLRVRGQRDERLRNERAANSDGPAATDQQE